jgi:predicted DNA-binding protein (UPF0251 family)
MLGKKLQSMVNVLKNVACFQEEMVKEEHRQALMVKGGMDERERIRLLRIFGLEREQAKQRIMTMTSSVGIGIPCV